MVLNVITYHNIYTFKSCLPTTLWCRLYETFEASFWFINNKNYNNNVQPTSFLPRIKFFFSINDLYNINLLYINFQEEFHQISMQLINNQTDALINGRLRNAFTLLTTGIEFNGQHLMKCRFKNNFDSFTTNIRGFLFVK